MSNLAEYINTADREKSVRKIFEGVEYSDFENEKLLELKEEIRNRNIMLPSELFKIYSVGKKKITY